MKLVAGDARPSSVEALVYLGCPCRDPPVCHRVQDDSVANRQPFSVIVGTSPVMLSRLANVFVSFVLCDGVPHCKIIILQTNFNSCVLWHLRILTPLLDDKRCLASSLSFPTVPLNTTMPLVTRFVGSQRHLWYMRNLFSYLSNSSCSLGMLSVAVVPKTGCSSAYVLCLCGLGSSLLLRLLLSFGLSLSREPSRCGLGLLRYTGFKGVPFVLSTSSASAFDGHWDL